MAGGERIWGYMVMDRDLTWGAEYTVQYKDDGL